MYFKSYVRELFNESKIIFNKTREQLLSKSFYFPWQQYRRLKLSREAYFKIVVCYFKNVESAF